MTRSSAWMLVMLAGCALGEDKATWGTLDCGSDPVQGHLATRMWCGDQWRTWHDEDQAASAGRIVDGVHQPAHTMWWPSGKVAGKLEGDVMTVFDESGAPVATQPWSGGSPVACPGTRKDETLETGHRKVWCVDAEDRPVGRMVTWRADGSVEAVQHWADGVRHGTFEAYHPDGDLWIRGEFVAGKKHGPWLTWDGTGKIHQDALEPDWVDHTPTNGWIGAPGLLGSADE